MSTPADGVPGDRRSASQRAARSTALRAVGEVVAKLGTLAVFVLLARSLGATAFGQFTFALSLASILVMGTGVGTEALLSREVAREPDRLGELLNDVLALKAVLSVLVMVVAGVLLWLGGTSATGLAVFAMVGGGTLLDNLQRTWHSVFQAVERAEYIAGVLIVQRTVTAAGTAILVVLGGDVVVASAVFLGGSAVGVVLAEVSLRTRVGRPASRVSPRAWLGLVRIGLPLGLLSVCSVVLLRLDMALLGFLAGAREVGIYGAAFRLLEATMFISWSFCGAIGPWFARTAELPQDAVSGGVVLALKALFATLVPLAVGLGTFAAPIVGLLYGEAYVDAVAPLRVLAIVVACTGLSELAATLLMNRDRPNRLLVLLPPLILLNVVLNLVFVPTYGALAAAWASAATAILLVGLSARQARTVTGPLRWGRALSGPVLAGAAMGVVGLVMPGPWPLAALVAGLAYVGTLAAFELRFHPSDTEAVRAAVRRRPAQAAAPVA